MIADFVASWPLFADTYLAAWLIAGLLSLVGVWVVARDQIFLGAAVSQASTLGTAVALFLQGMASSHALESDALTFLFAVLASISTALITSHARGRKGGESPEAITGWVFLVGGSVPVIMMAQDPHGLEEVHRLLFSSILGASRTDVWLFGLLLVGTAIAVSALHRRLTLFAMDPEMAEAVGLSGRRFRWGTAVWLGTAVGLAIHSAGMIYTFGCLVLPALVARNLCREVRWMFLLAPVVGVCGAIVAFVLANAWDVPPGQLSVALLCLLLALAWALRGHRQGSS
jgi:ABC-type Mn2+/Zn2+ transport system permease subunit